MLSIGSRRLGFAREMLGFADTRHFVTFQQSEFVATTIPAGTINFGCGQPSPFLLAKDFFQKTAQQAFSDFDPLLLQYGSIEGNLSFRKSLAEWLTNKYRHNLSSDDLIISAGNSMALSWICRKYCAPGDIVVTENPTYHNVKTIFTDLSLTIKAIPVTMEGISVEELENFIAQEKKIPKIIYTIPFHQNPTGFYSSQNQRTKLIEFAKKYNIVIISDDPYPFLNYKPLLAPEIPDNPHYTSTELHPRDFNEWDASGCECLVNPQDENNPVISIGTFSKIIAPGLRLGWIYSTSQHIKAIKQEGIVNSGGGVNQVSSQIVHKFITEGYLDKHIIYLRKIYSWRLQVLSETISSIFPSSFTHYRPNGGYFLWLNFPEDVKWTNEIAEYAKNHESLIIPPGSRFNVAPNLLFTNSVRLSFAFYTADELADGARKLKKVLEIFYPKHFQ